jgi:hypothetical protein
MCLLFFIIYIYVLSDVYIYYSYLLFLCIVQLLRFSRFVSAQARSSLLCIVIVDLCLQAAISILNMHYATASSSYAVSRSLRDL